MLSLRSRATPVCGLALVATVGACENPQSQVVLENDYGTTPARSLVVYRGFWHAVSFAQPLVPGASSDPQVTVPSSASTAYVLLAPAWDPASTDAPSTLVVLQSRSPFSVHLGDSLRIAVDDATFAGNCSAGSALTQEQADFVTQIVFPDAFNGLRYDAATCTTTPAGDGGTD